MFSTRHTQPKNRLVDVKGILHVAINQAGCIDECHQTELLLLGCRNLRVQVIDHAC